MNALQPMRDSDERRQGRARDAALPRGRNGVLALCLTILVLPSLSGCFVPLTPEDRQAYLNRPKTPSSEPVLRAPRRSVPAPAVQSATPRAAPAAVEVEPAQAPYTAPTESVGREALTPLPGRVESAELPPVEPAVAEAAPAAIPAAARHVVQPGDTVYGVSRQFGISKDDLIAENGLTAPYTLSVGQELAIPAAGKIAPEPATAADASPAAAAVSATKPHRVAKGETVYGIARANGVPLRALIELNGLRPPYTLAVGQSLAVPQRRHHDVAKGDTLYSIARAYGVDQSELVRANGIAAPYTIMPNDRLIVPVKLPATSPAVQQPPAAQAPTRTARVSPAPELIPTPPPRAANRFLWPVRGKVLLNYGPKQGGLHNDGINIAAPRGTPVLSAENGVVVYTGNELRGFGNLVLVRHADGWVTAYAHTEEILVRRGDTVRRGQPIGRVGSSGNVAQPQLHFEVRKGTRAVDPSRMLGPQTATAQN